MHTLIWFSRLSLSAILLSSLSCPLALAQPSQPAGSDAAPPVQSTNDDSFPRVRLTYYAGSEGRSWKEVHFIDLTEWTLAVDVYLELTWKELTANYAPVQRGRKQNFSSAPRQAVWNVRYEPAGTEGQSRLFVNGVGSRHGRVRIYSDTDFIKLLYLSEPGWYELGAEARLVRFLQQRRLNLVQPLPTRSQ